MSITVDVRGVDKVAAQIRMAGLRATAGGQKVVAQTGLKLQAKVRANASGRPGPNVITGDYRRSITLEVHGLTATVFSNRPQAARLEFGFHGADSLGRSYSNEPLPHFGPAGLQIAPDFVLAVLAMAKGLFV